MRPDRRKAIAAETASDAAGREIEETLDQRTLDRISVRQCESLSTALVSPLHPS